MKLGPNKILVTALMLIAMIIIMLFSFYGGFTSNFETKSFEEKRTNILDEISLAIEEAVVQGKYKCCIDPSCTMCYMGDWVWDDGTCDCDGMILKGEWDNVCPQCKRGIEEGRCISGKTYTECNVSVGDEK